MVVACRIAIRESIAFFANLSTKVPRILSYVPTNDEVKLALTSEG